MGGRVTPSQPGQVARAKRLKKALDSGSPPTFILPEDGGVLPATCPYLSPQNGKAADIRFCYLHQAFENSPDGFSIVDKDIRVISVNEAFRRMFGYAAADLAGQPIEHLIVPAERVAETRWIAERLHSGEKVTLETQRRKKDGTLLDILLACTPLVAEGKVIGAHAVYRDISDRKRAEALSSALYRIAEKSGAAHDLQQFFASIHGIVDELMYAKNFYIAMHDAANDRLTFPYFVDEQDSTPPPIKVGRTLTDYVLRTGEPLLATPEVFQELVDRGEVELCGAPSLDWLGVPLKAANRTFGVLVVQTYSKNFRYSERDKEILTFVSRQLATAVEHKKHEDSLRRSEARYRSLVHSSVYGIYRSSIEGKFLDVNPALTSMLGYASAEEVLSLDPRTDVFVRAEDQSQLMEEFRRTGRMDGIEVKWKRKDGQAITVRISGRAVSSADEPADVLEAIAEDVTERRILEDQFRQAQKMEAVGRLAGGIAHDFNNLLMVIGGYTEVILNGLDPAHPLEQKARAVQAAADRASMLTRQLLAFSRKQLLELKVVEVNAIISDMERLLRPLIGENIELVTRFDPKAGRTRADAGQLEQVLMNLVVNAKDALPKGGRVIIETSSVTVDGFHRHEPTFIRPGDYVVLSVIDNGHGMDKETQSRIFEPFFTTKEKGKGTGLGLSTVYGIVKQSGGYVMVQSELGSGTAFRIYLPRVDEAAAADGSTPAARAAAGGCETVLLVEDEESVRELVRDTLKAKGYHVLEADNGNAGIETASRHTDKIDLLITDVVMPGLGGRELAQNLLGVRPDLKVLFLSGYTEDAIVNEGTLEKGKAFLQKPFTLQALSRKVREILG
ncbi:MAG TPA: PAS domain S-box protein [Candidatus Sulfotelmatobacter sp.]|nr:PAS domain S-box protein [Candidatus Sulfotelmatobacter sp.]